MSRRPEKAGDELPGPREQRPDRSRRNTWLAVGLLAASALVAVRVSLRRQLLEGDGPANGGAMDGLELELYGPRGAVAIGPVPGGAPSGYGEFTWEPAAPEGGTYRVRVYDARDGRRPLLESPDLIEARWTPAEAIEAEHIRWVVGVRSADGRRLGSSEQEAWSGSRR